MNVSTCSIIDDIAAVFLSSNVLFTETSSAKYCSGEITPRDYSLNSFIEFQSIILGAFQSAYILGPDTGKQTRRVNPTQ